MLSDKLKSLRSTLDENTHGGSSSLFIDARYVGKLDAILAAMIDDALALEAQIVPDGGRHASAQILPFPPAA